MRKTKIKQYIVIIVLSFFCLPNLNIANDSAQFSISPAYAGLNVTGGYFNIYNTDGSLVNEPAVFYSGQAANIAAANLGGYNYLLAYTDNNQDGYGQFMIYNQYANVMLPAKTFNAAQTDSISPLYIDDSVYGIAYSDGADQGRGYFKFFNQSGDEQSRSEAFSVQNVSEIATLLTDNGNIFTVYNEGETKAGKYAIISTDGEVLKGPLDFSANAISNLSVIKMANKNVVLAFSDKTANVGKYMIFNEEGAVVKSETIFNNNPTKDLTVTETANEQIFISYIDESNNNIGTWKILSADGSLISGPTSFTNRAIDEIYSSSLYNNNIMIVYSDRANGQGAFVIYNPTGDEVKSETIVSSKMIAEPFILNMNNRNALIAYLNIELAPCLESDWTYSLAPDSCPATSEQTKTWVRIGNCVGGVEHPATEKVSCEYEDGQAPACVESDWTYTLEPLTCPDNSEQVKTWLKSGNCTGGVWHASEKIKCQTADKKVFNISNKVLYNSLKGKIILKVQGKGEAYYVNPNKMSLHYLGRPADAFQIMRELGLGITDADLAKIPLSNENIQTRYRTFVNAQKGKILLQVQQKGQAYYVNPKDGKRYFLGRPTDAFNVMRQLGLGISNTDIETLIK